MSSPSGEAQYSPDTSATLPRSGERGIIERTIGKRLDSIERMVSLQSGLEAKFSNNAALERKIDAVLLALGVNNGPPSGAGGCSNIFPAGAGIGRNLGQGPPDFTFATGAESGNSVIYKAPRPIPLVGQMSMKKVNESRQGLHPVEIQEISGIVGSDDEDDYEYTAEVRNLVGLWGEHAK